MLTHSFPIFLALKTMRATKQDVVYLWQSNTAMDIERGRKVKEYVKNMVSAKGMTLQDTRATAGTIEESEQELRLGLVGANWTNNGYHEDYLLVPTDSKKTPT